jgi:predicted phosphoribosyltransferase
VFLVDDGLATGATMRAAVAAVRSQNPARIIVAVPVASKDTCREVGALVDELVCLWTPRPFRSVGQAYQNFEQTTDGEVREILDAAQKWGQA